MMNDGHLCPLCGSRLAESDAFSLTESMERYDKESKARAFAAFCARGDWAANTEGRGVGGKAFAVLAFPGQRGTLFCKHALQFDSSADVLHDLAPLREVDLWINSIGGSANDAVLLYGALRPKATVATIQGVCASAALIVALSAPHVRIDKAARIGTHAASCTCIGTAQELRQAAALAQEITSFMAVMIKRKTAAPERTVKNWLRGPMKWWSAEQALEAGLVDEIVDLSGAAQKMANLPAAVEN